MSSNTDMVIRNSFSAPGFGASKLYIRESIGDIDGVNVTGVTNGQVLTYDGPNDVWIPSTVASLIPEYGSIYVAAGATAQTTNAVANTFDTVTGFTTDGGVAAVLTEAAASNKITIPAGSAGRVYSVQWHASFESGGNRTYTVAVFVDGVQCAGAGTAAHFVGSTEIATIAALSCLESVGAGAVDVTLGVATNGSSDSFTPVDMGLSVVRVA